MGGVIGRGTGSNWYRLVGADGRAIGGEIGRDTGYAIGLRDSEDLSGFLGYGLFDRLWQLCRPNLMLLCRFIFDENFMGPFLGLEGVLGWNGKYFINLKSNSVISYLIEAALGKASFGVGFV